MQNLEDGKRIVWKDGSYLPLLQGQFFLCCPFMHLLRGMPYNKGFQSVRGFQQMSGGAREESRNVNLIN